MAGTSTSSGLNNLLSDTNQTQTTLPSWMDAAQQNVINQAGTAAAGAPAFSQTTGQQAVNTLSGPNNPFAQGQTTLNQIATGAANPWIVDPTTGNVTPNTSTALGGLFQAENQQLNQILPTQTAGTEAGAIGSGNFGSLRGQTAVDTARANAMAQLQAQQMTAALQNQSTGAQAASGLGTLGTQGTTADLTTGAAQMNAPFQGVTNYANLVNAVNAPATVSTQNQMSPLSMIGSLSSIPTAGTSLLNSLFGKAAVGTPGTSGYIPGVQGLLPSLSSAFGSNSSTSTPTDTSSAVSTSPDNSYQYSGSANTPTSTGANSASDIQQAAIDQGYTSYDPLAN